MQFVHDCTKSFDGSPLYVIRTLSDPGRVFMGDSIELSLIAKKSYIN